MPSAPVVIGAAAIATAIVAAAPSQPGPAREPHRLLAALAGFGPPDFARLDAGQPIVRILDTPRREVAVVGAIRVRSTRERLLARHRNVSTLASSDMVLQVGAIGAPPRAADFDPIAFEAYDLDTIRECEPGDCGVRLSTAQLAAFRREVDWQAPDWRARAAALWRRLLAEYASDYLARGALADYRNKAEPLNVADEFASIFSQSGPAAAALPPFVAYLQQFPRAPLDGVETILYWSKEDFGLRPVTSLTHLALFLPRDPALPAAIGTRRIYATHYFDAALGLTFGFPDGGSGLYVVTVNRARTRSLASFTRTIVRGIVLRRSRDGVEKMLRSTKSDLEKTK